jgi:hypothetical protein
MHGGVRVLEIERELCTYVPLISQLESLPSVILRVADGLSTAVAIADEPEDSSGKGLVHSSPKTGLGGGGDR